jgi:hypothetical protein
MPVTQAARQPDPPNDDHANRAPTEGDRRCISSDYPPAPEVLTVTEDPHGCGVVVADGPGVEEPYRVFAGGAGWVRCRLVRGGAGLLLLMFFGFCDGCAGGFLVDDGVVCGVGGDEGL